jgi:hypothetical protein
MTGPPASQCGLVEAAACANPDFASSRLRSGMLSEPSAPSAVEADTVEMPGGY